MNKGLFLLAFVSVGILASSCIPEATDVERKTMCENLQKLRGEIDTSTAAQASAKVEEKFAKEEKRLKDWLAKDLKSWDDERDPKVEAAKKEKEKKAILEEYAKKKEITTQQHVPGIEELKPKKEKAIAEAKEKAEANLALYKKTIEQCQAEAKKEGLSQKAAQCRISATSTDTYWNKCK